MAAITNFIVTPLAFLSGTFYSVEALPPVLNDITHCNPIFYLIDGRALRDDRGVGQHARPGRWLIAVGHDAGGQPAGVVDVSRPATG